MKKYFIIGIGILFQLDPEYSYSQNWIEDRFGAKTINDYVLLRANIEAKQVYQELDPKSPNISKQHSLTLGGRNIFVSNSDKVNIDLSFINPFKFNIKIYSDYFEDENFKNLSSGLNIITDVLSKTTGVGSPSTNGTYVASPTQTSTLGLESVKKASTFYTRSPEWYTWSVFKSQLQENINEPRSVSSDVFRYVIQKDGSRSRQKTIQKTPVKIPTILKEDKTLWNTTSLIEKVDEDLTALLFKKNSSQTEELVFKNLLDKFSDLKNIDNKTELDKELNILTSDIKKYLTDVKKGISDINSLNFSVKSNLKSYISSIDEELIKLNDSLNLNKKNQNQLGAVQDIRQYKYNFDESVNLSSNNSENSLNPLNAKISILTSTKNFSIYTINITNQYSQRVASELSYQKESLEKILEIFSNYKTILFDQKLNCFILNEVVIKRGEKTKVRITISKQDNIEDKLDFDFDIVRYSKVLVEFSTGYAFTNFSDFRFGSTFDSTSNSLQVSKSTSRVSNFTILSNLNFVTDMGLNYAYPFFQIGAGFAGLKNITPLVSTGVGLRFFQPVDFSLSLGTLWHWEQNLKTLQVGEKVQSTEIVEQDLGFKFITRPNFYLGFQYHF